MKKLQRVFLDEERNLRVGWKLTVGISAYAVVFYGAILILSSVFGALFKGWGLTNDNLIYAPRWARMIVQLHADFTYALAYGLSMATAMMLAKRWSQPVRGDSRAAVFGSLAGLGLGALVSMFALLLDSMRLEWPLSEPVFSSTQLLSLAVMALGVLSGEALTKRIVFDTVRCRFGRLWSYAAAAAFAVLLSGRWTSPIGLFNALLLSAVGCALYERGGLLVSAALQFGWAVWTSMIFAWPDSGAAAIFKMYTVSDAWLTGGNAGANFGVGCTIGWTIIAAVLLWKDLKREFAVEKKERNTNG